MSEAAALASATASPVRAATLQAVTSPAHPAQTAGGPPTPRLEIPSYDLAATLALQRELGISHVLAQVLVRRGFADPLAAREFLHPSEAHEPSAFAGIERAVELIERHAGTAGRITVHGDYDVDGVCATAIMVRALQRARRQRRLVPAEPDRGRLRRVGRDGQPARCARHPPAGHGRLRDHRGRGGRGGARRRPRRRRQRPSCAAGGRLAAGLRRSSIPACAAIHVRICAGPPWPSSSRRRCGADARRPTTSSSWRSRRSPTSYRCEARTGGWCATGLAALANTASPGLRALMSRRRRRPERARHAMRSASASRPGSTPPAG